MLSDKVCIVTGAGHGIGEATAIELGKQGATVVANDLGTSLHGEGKSEEPATETAETIRETGGEAMAHFGDVSSLDYTEALVEDTMAEYGRVDGAVNFAGITRDGISYKLSGDAWDDVIRVHLRGHFSLIRNLGAHWREVARETDDWLEPQRSFLSITSGAAAFGNVGQANYSAAKAGILGLTRTTAQELSRYNIRVNALMPAGYTRMVDAVPDGQESFSADEIPPERSAPAVAFLLSDHAEDITGCTIRSVGDLLGIVSDPEVKRMGFSEEWTVEEVVKRFRDPIANGVELDKGGISR